MPPVGFEPTISAHVRLQTYALDRAATGTGVFYFFLAQLGCNMQFTLIVDSSIYYQNIARK